MRALSITLVFLAFVGTNSTQVPSEAPSSETPSSQTPSAVTSHSKIVQRLHSVFGEENCSENTVGNDNQQLFCIGDTPCFESQADYTYVDSTETPLFMGVQYGYVGGSSGRIEVDLTEDSDCGFECTESYLRSISQNLGVACDGSSKGPSAPPTRTPTATPTEAPIADSANEPTVLDPPLDDESTGTTVVTAPVVAPTNAPRTEATTQDLLFVPADSPSASDELSTTQKLQFVATNIRRPQRVGRFGS